MDIISMFKRRQERNEQKQQTSSNVPVVIDDDDDEDFKDSAAPRQVGGVKGKSERKTRKRTRQRIADSDSDTEVHTKISKPKPSTTPTRTSPRKSVKSSVSTSKRSRPSKQSPTTPKTQKKQMSACTITSFFGSVPIKRTSVKKQSSESFSDCKPTTTDNGKEEVHRNDSPSEDLFEIPESPLDSVIFDDEEIAKALQEEELRIKMEKEKQVHDDEKFGKTLDELDRLDSIKTMSVKPPSKKLKLMMEKVPVSRSPSKTPQTTPVKTPSIYNKDSLPGPSTLATVEDKSQKSTSSKRLSKKRIQYVDESSDDPTRSIQLTPTKPVKPVPHATTSSTRSPTKSSVLSSTVTPKSLSKSNVSTPVSSKPVLTTPSSTRHSYKKLSATPEPFTPGSTGSKSLSPSGASTTSDTPKPSRSDSYKRYLSRSGPKALGSKPIPEGQEGCLEGLTFVITGVLDSLDRDDSENLVKKYGGKVTGSVSGRTSYLVVGEDAGLSKLAKADKLGTEQINEDGLLDLIRTKPGKKPGKGPTAPTKKPPVKRKSSNPPKPVESFPVTSKVKQFYSSSHVSSTTSATSSHVTPVATGTAKTEEEVSLLWVDRYRPKSTKSIIGQSGNKSNAKKLSKWLHDWESNHLRPEGGRAKQPGGGRSFQEDGSSYKAALLSGPPGIGKTTTATLVCEEAGYSYVEQNASTNRNKSTLHGNVGAQVGSLSIDSFMDGAKGGVACGRRHVLIMDEVDGMAGNADRGGMQELISMIKSSKIPIICICNDRQSTKVRSLANYCYDLRFQKPRAEQIKGAMMSVCFKEGVKIEPAALMEMIIASGQDVRQVLHNLSLWSALDKPLSLDVAKESAMNSRKHSKKNPFDVVRTVFAPRDGDRELSLFEKSDLFFHDYNIAALFVQENYLSAKPASANGDRRATIKCIARAADSLCGGDLIEKQIRKSSRWELLPLQAFFSSVIPGEVMKGFLGKPVFPCWLGNNSKQSKHDRMLQDLQRHTRLMTSCSKTEFGMDYLPFLSSKLTHPLLSKGSESVQDVLSTMRTYDLLREDWDSIQELAHFNGGPDVVSQIPSKVKASFTRLYNKDKHLLHYTTEAKKPQKRTSVDEMYNATGEGDDVMANGSDSEEERIESNPMIKVSKKGDSSKTSGRSKGSVSSSSSQRSKKGKATKKGKK